MSPRSNRKTSTWSAVNFKKHMTSMSCRLEPAIWSRDTGQQIPCFDRCQLIITWMSNVKEVHCKPSLHVPVDLLFGRWPPSCVTPPSSSPSIWFPSFELRIPTAHDFCVIGAHKWARARTKRKRFFLRSFPCFALRILTAHNLWRH